MTKALSLLLLVSALVAVGCGGNEGANSTQTAVSTTATAPTTLSKCHGAAANWGSSVSGISCEAAGQFIAHHALLDFPQPPHTNSYATIKRSKPGEFTSAGFACRFNPLPRGDGWHVACARPGQAVAFDITP
jgi:hypothetical protein